MPLGPFATPSDFVSQCLTAWPQQVRDCLILAIIDKTRPPSPEDAEGALAGMVAFLRTSATHLSTEIGGIVILPAFHRTHVTTNAVGLMLRCALGGAQDGGLGLRRVVWQASTMNAASIRVAERLGFRREGVLRWHYVFRNGLARHKVGNGRPLPPGSEEGDLGRDTVVLSLCWDDWEGGVREHVERAMARTE
ncbi:putative N-acetyltransferase [Parachaetomium inaequale]|uniref:N-acetyltransferase n=1 Tax=Parachaetomium inaequale TaxID=2588326 RepID=A0AAN6P820_9PEZI|nr:putative N-acetyltransferase [Parachaetomium inaequale]